MELKFNFLDSHVSVDDEGGGEKREKNRKPKRIPSEDKGRTAGDISDEIYELTFANIFSHVNNEIVVMRWR